MKGKRKARSYPHGKFISSKKHVKCLGVVLCSLTILAACCCIERGINDNPAVGIKEVIAYNDPNHRMNESDGMVVNLILMDSSGDMTASDGEVTLTVSEIRQGWDPEKSEFADEETVLFVNRSKITRADFDKLSEWGRYEEFVAIIVRLGRFEYAQFSKAPSQPSGIVKVEFLTPEGRSLRKEETIYF
ncbi:MAG TPA: hypothetical protein HA349_11295 [Methanotrichaceae archaeon]|nr:hypothetical protein [Methanotrichaceae archaeon]